MDVRALWLARFLAALFALNSVANLINVKPLREEFARWRLRSWLRFFNAGWQIVTAGYLVMPSAVAVGVAMGFCVCIGISAIVGARAKKYSHCAPGVVLALLFAGVAAGIR
jgi:hypothetical protein